MAKKNEYISIGRVLNRIKTTLDAQLREGTAKKVSILFACNSVGKTRLSSLFHERNRGELLYYNALTEDLYSWNNDGFILNIHADSWIFETLSDEGLIQKSVDNFKRFIALKLYPDIDIPNSRITFSVETDKSEHSKKAAKSTNIKISRGEESVFIWSIFYTILETAIRELNDSEELRSTTVFNNIKYIVIDDPVSSMDDTRIITIALELAELIAKSKSELKFLITTHHPLFFNVLFNFGRNERDWDKNNYVLSKYGAKLILKGQGIDSPFAYHHSIISEISNAIKEGNLKKYHFNLFRALLEKTANFLGYPGWKKLLAELTVRETVMKKLNHFSHDRLSDLDEKNLQEDEIEEFKVVFEAFIDEFNWHKANFTDLK